MERTGTPSGAPRYVGCEPGRVIELAGQDNMEELSRVHPNSICKAVYNHWPDRERMPDIIPKLLKLGSESDWYTHFNLRMLEGSHTRHQSSLWLSQDTAGATQNQLSRGDDDELDDINEAIALEIVRKSPALLFHIQVDDSRRTVVHLGAAYGSAKLFAKLLTFAKAFADDRYIEPFRLRDKLGNTPLSLAMARRRDKDNIAIVRGLLQDTDVEIDEDSWRYATGLGRGNAIEDIYEDALLLFMKCRAASINDLLIKCAMRHEKLFESLLDINDSHAWHDKLLFLAVEIRNIQAVEKLLERFPRLAIAKKDNKSVLHFVSEITDDSETRKGMRAVIAPYVIRQVEEESRSKVAEPENSPSLSSQEDEEEDGEGPLGPLSTTEKIRALLADKPGKEISLDLAGFKQSKQPIEHLLSMVDLNAKAENQPANGKTQEPLQEPTLSVNFESTLSFVDIPVPNLPQAKVTENIGTPIRDEVKRILDWLRGEKEVTGIYELRVRDSLFIPHCEEIIKNCLDKFDIEVLDWERVDLSLEPLKDTCKNLKQLTLYGSSWTSLQYWTGEDAMILFDKSLPKIKKITIFVVEDLVGQQLSKVYKDEAIKRLDTLLPKTPSSPSSRHNVCRDVFNVEIRSWPSLEHSGDSGDSITQTTAIEATRLTEFLTKYNILQRAFRDKSWRDDFELNAKLMPYIKVAVIDTGVDPGSIKCTRIHGASFVPSGTGGGESPWWFSQYPHGTQVAKIITEIDPYCELLVAKVGDAHRDMTTQRVTEAVNWARQCKADIISMSATIRKSPALQEAVTDAISEGILVLGSTTGEGYVDEEAWPANFESVLSIGAAKLTGKETEESIRDNAKYMFPGKDILVSTSFLGSQPWKTEVSGTSFATAIAAGVASLILACRRLALSTQPDPKKWVSDLKSRRKIVTDVFNVMSVNRGRYVKPWTVFYQDEGQPSWGEADSILRWVKEQFLKNEESQT